MNKSLLIFGVSGFVGKYLAEEFYKNGYEIYGSDVICSVSVPDYVKFTECDLLDSDKVSKLIDNIKPTHIINLAAVSSVGLSWKIPQKTMQVNVLGALNILESAKGLNVKPKVMFIGSSEEYEISDKPINEKKPLNANNPYGISKVTQERFAKLYRKHYGMKIYCVRPFNHTGVGQPDTFVIPSWCKQAAEISKSGKKGIMKVGNLEVSRDFSNVRDIVNAYRLIIEDNDCENVFNVGSGQSILLKDLLDYIVSLSSQPIEVKTDPELFRLADNPYICCDNSLIKEKLGWKPVYSILDTVKEIFEYYNN